MNNSVIDLTMSDYSDGEENQSSEFEEEMDEFPYQCKQCPENFRYMAEAQSHFFQYHQSNEKQNRGKDKYFSSSYLFTRYCLGIID